MKTILYERIVASLKLLSISFAMLGLVLVAGLTAGTPVMAATPDGETPANEGVCDVLKTNTTPGLYGLCVAYCEAQDLDSFDKEPTNSKILANYNKKKQASDPDMPCVKVPCPCWSDAELASFKADNIATCAQTSSTIISITDNTPALHFADANTSLGRERCRYRDENTLPKIFRVFGITAAEAETCFNAITTVCSTPAP